MQEIKIISWLILVFTTIVLIFVVKNHYNPKIIYSIEYGRYCILYEKTIYEGQINGGDYRFELRRILLPKWLNLFKKDD